MRFCRFGCGSGLKAAVQEELRRQPKCDWHGGNAGPAKGGRVSFGYYYLAFEGLPKRLGGLMAVGKWMRFGLSRRRAAEVFADGHRPTSFGQGWRRCFVRNFCIGQSLKRQMAEIWGLAHDYDMGGRSIMSLRPELFGFCWWIYNYASPTGFQKSLITGWQTFPEEEAISKRLGGVMAVCTDRRALANRRARICHDGGLGRRPSAHPAYLGTIYVLTLALT